MFKVDDFVKMLTNNNRRGTVIQLFYSPACNRYYVREEKEHPESDGEMYYEYELELISRG